MLPEVGGVGAGFGGSEQFALEGWRPLMVVTTTTRSGMTGGVSWARAQTVSVMTAGDMPVTARRMVWVVGGSGGEAGRGEGSAGVVLRLDDFMGRSQARGFGVTGEKGSGGGGSGELEAAGIGQGGAAGNALDAAIDFGGVFDGFFELGFALGPLFFEGAAFVGELLAEGEKDFDDAFDVLAELDTANVVVKEGGFVRAAGILGALEGGVEEALAEGGGQRAGKGGFADPDAVELAHAVDGFRGAGGHQDGQFGFGIALVLLQFFDPGGLPVFGALAFPEDGAANQAGVGADLLLDVGAALALLTSEISSEGNN